jgi:hypothetical protein
MKATIQEEKQGWDEYLGEKRTLNPFGKLYGMPKEQSYHQHQESLERQMDNRGNLKIHGKTSHFIDSIQGKLTL